MVRRILHIDMDAFFASVEQADNPDIAGKPVIVGGGSMRGVVSASSYEARKYGVRSAMPMFKAKKLCPHGIFVPVRGSRYKEISDQVMDILRRYSPLVEVASIDEAYVDVTGIERLFGPAERIAARIKQDVRSQTGLTCSVGVAPNKFLAKIASDMDKPDGLTVVRPEDVALFMENLPIGKVPGVGERTLETLGGFGIRTAGDVLRYPVEFWRARLGKYGESLHERARGVHESPVRPYSDPKSQSAEVTFPRDIGKVEDLKKFLFLQAERVGQDLRRYGFHGRTVTLKLKYADHRLVTRSRTLREPTCATKVIYRAAAELLDDLGPRRKARLIGVGVSNLVRPERQISLFSNNDSSRQEVLDRVIDEIRQKFGAGALKRGKAFDFES